MSKVPTEYENKGEIVRITYQSFPFESGDLGRQLGSLTDLTGAADAIYPMC